MMEGTPAIYLDRIVDKEHFRAFIYAPNGEKRLVESWDEFETRMQSGVWFATVDDAKASIAQPETEKLEVEEKPKTRQRKSKKKEGVLNEVEKMLEEEQIEMPDEDAAFEVTDDFLPKG